MQKEELKKKITEAIKQYPVASVATIRDGKPWARYMAMQSEEDLSLYSTSFALSRKICQIRKDDNVHVIFGADPKNFMLPYINVIGKAEILTDLEIKKKCWCEMLAQFFKGPEDPNYVVVKIAPTKVEYWQHGAGQPEVYEA